MRPRWISVSHRLSIVRWAPRRFRPH